MPSAGSWTRRRWFDIAIAYVVAGVIVLDEVEILVVPDDRLAADLQADQPLIHALLLDSGERLFSDEILFAQVHLPAEPDFIGVVLYVHVLAVGEDARFQRRIWLGAITPRLNSSPCSRMVGQTSSAWSMASCR